MSNPLIVWRYEDAPPELQISEAGGDEEWLVEVPPEYVERYISWMESPAFNICGEYQSSPHPTKPGWQIRISSH